MKRENLSKKKLKTFLIDFVVLLVSCIAGAFSTVGVLIPNGLTSGGITGIVRIVQKFVDVDFSILFYSGSFVVLLLVALLLGIREARKILMLSIMYPTVTFIFERLDIQLLEHNDVLLAAVFCGLFTGIHVGLMLWRGYATADTDAIAKVINRRLLPGVSISKLLLMIDAVIIISSAFVYGRNIALYALITQVILTKTAEVVVYGFESKIVQLNIITDKHEELQKYIMEEMERGVSTMTVRGGYTDSDMIQLMLLCTPGESFYLKRKLVELDPKAFVTITRVEDVWGSGRGFTDIRREY